jgi:hypothetical protein
MQELIITSKDQLQTLVIDAVNTCLDYRIPTIDKQPIEIINREELCKRLDIAEPTAIRWEKKGKIPSFRIGSNVRYNWPKVIESLEGQRKAA